MRINKIWAAFTIILILSSAPGFASSLEGPIINENSQRPLGHEVRGRKPPEEAVMACQNHNAGDQVEFTTPFGDRVYGICLEIEGILAAVPEQDFNPEDEEDPEDSSDDNTSVESLILPYAIIDTAQKSWCDNFQVLEECPSEWQSFCGQDAQYEGFISSYSFGSQGLTVYDNLTGLTWTHSPDLNEDGRIDSSDKLSFQEAGAYVKTLNNQNFAGYSDWRLPTIKQLYSLIDFQGTDPAPDSTVDVGSTPFIDTDYFAFAFGDVNSGERIIDSQWVTSSLYTADDSMMFGVNFADGRIKGYGLNMGDREKTFYVRLCRGNSQYGINKLQDNKDGTVTDHATGLMWSKADSGYGMTWQEALKLVDMANNSSYMGYNDWRLPNAKELQSIVDYNRSPDTTNSAAIDPVFYTTAIMNEAGEVDYPFFWTGTNHKRVDGFCDSAVYIAFGRCLGSFDGVDIVDVHGAGCQRSDPKQGDLNEFPRVGSGPQGDVQRVFNYVRLVRNLN